MDSYVLNMLDADQLLYLLPVEIRNRITSKDDYEGIAKAYLYIRKPGDLRKLFLKYSLKFLQTLQEADFVNA